MKKKILFLLISLVLLAGAAFAIFMGIKSSESEEPSGGSSLSNNNTKNGGVLKNRKVAFIDKHATVSEITSEKGVVNIYMFWGDGCPHCEKQWEYLEEIAKEYPNDFKVYGFELWYTKSNKEVLKTFYKAVGDEEITAVPYTVIGDKGYRGTISQKSLVDLIEYYKDKNIDIYFDKIQSK